MFHDKFLCFWMVFIYRFDGRETCTVAGLYDNYQKTIHWYIDADINIKTDIFVRINVGDQWNI